MQLWMVLVAGLIIGWLVEWLIDWRFWRRELNASLDDEQRWRMDLERANREISRLQEQIAHLTATMDKPTVAPPNQENDWVEKVN